MSLGIVCLLSTATSAQTTNATPTQIRITGLENESLRADMGKVSELLKGNVRPNASPRQIAWQAERDIVKMKDVMNAAGYFATDIKLVTDSTSTPETVTFGFTPGPVFTIGELTVRFKNGDPSETKDLSRAGKENTALPAIASQIISQGALILKHHRNNGYPFSKLLTRSLDINPEEARVNIILDIDRGEKARVGKITVKGLTSISRDILKTKIGIKEGDPFDEAALRKTEVDLLGTGLFSIARCKHETEVETDGTIPVTIEVTERKHRTVRLGIEYNSDTGVGVKTKWEHRNITGRGDRLHADAKLSEIGKEGLIGYARPYMKTLPFEMALDLEFGDEETDAYDNYAGELRWLYAWKPINHLRLISGVGFRHTEVEQLDIDQDADLFFVPLILNWDKRNDILDPTSGYVGIAAATWADDQKTDLAFTQTTLGGSAYYSPKRMSHLTLAAKLEFTSITGADRDEIPADSRLYAGGANSVRGYQYQSIGPRSGDTPLGGTHRFTSSVELRYRGAGNLGGVVFVDSGSVIGDNPEDDNTRTAVGLGARFNTGMGPIRVDLAFPINPRDDVDNSVELYVSIGQFF